MKHRSSLLYTCSFKSSGQMLFHEILEQYSRGEVAGVNTFIFGFNDAFIETVVLANCARRHACSVALEVALTFLCH